ncbi:MAG: ABC transporter permease [Alphaproteobacteria bacterium]|nr:ABC transporter permease [Alphaproteobacteria bacterium]
MNWIQFIGAVEMGLIYSLVAIGVFLSFRTLQFPDMTVDGSFPLGAAVCASLIVHGVHPVIATGAAILAGALAGLITAWLSTHLKMLNLLAGILTMTALYSLNLRIMGRSNIALLGEKTIVTEWFTFINGFVSCHVVPLAIIIAVFSGLIYCFLNTRLGLSIRATGSNARMSRAQGINDHKMIWLGLSVSNALVATAGALFAQIHGFADVTMGVGTIIIGLAAVIIGEAVLPIRTIFQAILACVFGAILYRLVIAMALNASDFGLQASDLNLVTSILVALAMLLPSLKRHVKALS